MYHTPKFKIVYVNVSPRLASRFFRWKTRCNTQAIHYRRSLSTRKSSTVSNFLHLFLSYLFQFCLSFNFIIYFLPLSFALVHPDQRSLTIVNTICLMSLMSTMPCRLDRLYATPIRTRLFYYSITFVFYYLHDTGSTWVRTYWPSFYDNRPNDHQTLSVSETDDHHLRFFTLISEIL